MCIRDRPVSWNPVDMVYLRLHEMHKFYYMHKLLGLYKERGIIYFNYARAKTPEGMKRINDNAFTVYMPPEMKKKEAYDYLFVEQLLNFAKSLGIETERYVNIGGKRWGYAVKEGDKVVTRFASPESVLAHEIGHILGWRYKLFSILRRKNEGKLVTIQKGKNKGQTKWKPNPEAVKYRKLIDEEWRKLADARYKDQEVAKSFKQYVRKSSEKEAVLIEAFLHAPEEFKKIAPTLYEEFVKFLNYHAELRPLLDIKPSLVLGESEANIKIPGFTTLGFYVASEPVANMINNYLSPGLRNNENALVRGGYNWTRFVANAVNMAQLSMSAFHGLNISIDIISSTLGLGVRKLTSKGQKLSGVKDILTVPVSPLLRIWDGTRIRKAYKDYIENIKDPKMRVMIEAVILAGGRDKLDTMYYNQGIRALQKTLSDVVKGLPKETAVGMLKLPFDLFTTTVEIASYPIMGWFVPNGKLGLFSLMAEHELERFRNGEINAEQLHYMLTTVWDSIDNRMGMLVYDNLFWNKTFKDTAMLAVRSVGWNLGSWREYGGSFVDVIDIQGRLERGDKVLSHKMAYVMSSIFIYGLIGALTHKILTGEDPDELKDYLFPKTGKKLPDGSDERLMFPLYSREWYSWYDRPYETIVNKLHPIWRIIYEISRNKDFFNVEIVHPDDPLERKAIDFAKYIGKKFLPISINNYFRMSKFTREPEEKKKNLYISITGITSAPAYITRTPAQKLMYRYIIDKISKGYKRTTEEYEKSVYRKYLLNQLRKGNAVDRDEAIEKLGYKEWISLLKEAREDEFQENFKKLTLPEMIRVYAIANKEEKEKARMTLKLKYFKNYRELSEDEREQYRKIIYQD